MPRRSPRTLAGVAVLACATTGALLASAGAPGTYALFSDYAVTEARVGAGTWEPPPPVVPAACGPASDYPGGVVVGTDGPNTISAGNQGQVVLGLDGDDVLVGGNGQDTCLGGTGYDDLQQCEEGDADPARGGATVAEPAPQPAAPEPVAPLPPVEPEESVEPTESATAVSPAD